MEGDVDINRALQAYLGCNSSGGYQPLGDHDARLRQAFPLESESARDAIEVYLREADGFAYPPEAQSLSAAGELVATTLHEKFPDLDDLSIRCLANRCTFRWR